MSGEYRLPWTRMHALKDYYGMVNVLEDFPQVHQTFDMVPSMMVQLEVMAGRGPQPLRGRRLFGAQAIYTLDDQALMGRKETEICAKVIPIY